MLGLDEGEHKEGKECGGPEREKRPKINTASLSHALTPRTDMTPMVVWVGHATRTQWDWAGVVCGSGVESSVKVERAQKHTDKQFLCPLSTVPSPCLPLPLCHHAATEFCALCLVQEKKTPPPDGKEKYSDPSCCCCSFVRGNNYCVKVGGSRHERDKTMPRRIGGRRKEDGRSRKGNWKGRCVPVCETACLSNDTQYRMHPFGQQKERESQCRIKKGYL